MRVAPDKLPETVGQMFVEGCDTYGWAYRTRWDHGKEALDAARAQLLHWDDPGNTHHHVLTGRSVHNTRIESLWLQLGRMTWYFIALFRVQMGKCRLRFGRPILDASNPGHLHALHIVFLPRIQEKLDTFRWAW